MFVTTLEMDNFDCTKMMAHFHSLSTGGAHSRVEASITSPTFPPYVGKKTHSSVPHTATVGISFLQHCSTNVKLRIQVKAQPSTPSTWPLSPTRLGIRPRDLGLPKEYTLGHCGFSAASRHELASTSRQYSLLTATDTTALY